MSLLDLKQRSPLPEIFGTGVDQKRIQKGPVLVIVPHPDDDILAVGGLIRLHRMQGDSVKVLVCFDGADGNSHSEEIGREEFIKMRQDEARRAGAHLGLKSDDYHFYGWSEGHGPPVKLFVEAAHKIADWILALEKLPMTVYAPWVGEYHMDHHVLARVVQVALALINYQGQAWGWEVWTPMVPTRIVDVSDVYTKKITALREHKSQIAHTNLIRMAMSINAYRSIYLATNDADQFECYGEALMPLGPVSQADWHLVLSRRKMLADNATLKR